MKKIFFTVAAAGLLLSVLSFSALPVMAAGTVAGKVKTVKTAAVKKAVSAATQEYRDAVKAANQAFADATKQAKTAYQAAVSKAKADLKTAQATKDKTLIAGAKTAYQAAMKAAKADLTSAQKQARDILQQAKKDALAKMKATQSSTSN